MIYLITNFKQSRCSLDYPDGDIHRSYREFETGL